MDVLQGGFNQGNLAVTSIIILGLIIVSTRANILDKAGILSASLLGFVVGGMGHWSWLLILLGFLLSSHKATKWRFEEKMDLGLSESSDGHRSWGNVIANGGMPGLVAVYAIISKDYVNGLWLFSAAVAVAASDTFASEIGSLDSNVKLITTLQPCQQGINGGYSPSGQKAAALGSLIISILTFCAWLIVNIDSLSDSLVWGISASIAIAIIGFLGCQVDSVLGAVLENRGYLTKGSVNALAISFGMIAMATFLEYFPFE
ncbi:MAG: DUF92 domain-containing protein [Candidatus Poseidoniaceae archaeon]|nr:DUF92 domain-containing protein [Candidatus Poseidoniaceae archaeon]